LTQIPDRLIRILRTCETDDGSRFPPTEIFNETWMLRLVLDAFQALGLEHKGLRIPKDAGWYCEALLKSPFWPRTRTDKLGEGLTNADAVIGDFEIGGNRQFLNGRTSRGWRSFQLSKGLCEAITLAQQ
jgi:hypothetical protein